MGGCGPWTRLVCGRCGHGVSMKSGEGREAISLQAKYFYSLVFIKWKQRESHVLTLWWSLITMLKIKLYIFPLFCTVFFLVDFYVTLQNFV